jgi:hypothetical protein
MRVRGMSATKTTLTVSDATGLRKGMLLAVDDELLLVRGVHGQTVATARYRGWHKLAYRAKARVRTAYRATRDAVYGWFEKEDDGDE